MPRFSPDDPVASSSSLHKEIPSGEERGKEGLKVGGEENSSFFSGRLSFYKGCFVVVWSPPHFLYHGYAPQKSSSKRSSRNTLNP